MWPSVHAKDYKKYIEADNGVVDAGQLGVMGQIGWCIPTYMVTGPELATWEGLETDAAMFATSESGIAGQIVDGDPSFVRSTSRSRTTSGWTSRWSTRGPRRPSSRHSTRRTRSRSPFLFYFWTPHWAQSKYDLTMVELPEITPECKDAVENDLESTRARTRADALYKAFNADLETRAPAAFAFLSAMNVHERRSELDRARDQ